MAQNINVLINDNIQEMEIRLIGSHGEQVGIMKTSEALAKAEDEGLDLVLIAPAANPPVCKIIDYSKYRYEQIRKEKEARKKQKIVEIKEIRFSPNIDVNDMNTKANAARKFILHGDKVKVSMRFRGREISHMQQRAHVLDEFAEKLADIAVIEKGTKAEGRCLVMFLVPKK
ncbi:MAG: translation initiation factor IF-3 [Lachnospiraceae bacterium]|nr:translation initiation factor IF-3 [Lachnospiraceae bacterium]